MFKSSSSSSAPSATSNSSGGPRCPDRASLMAFLAELGISDIQDRDHPEVFTVETMMPYLEGMEGVVGKNLFLKDKKKNLFLLSAKHDAQVRLNEVAKQVRFSILLFQRKGDSNRRWSRQKDVLWDRFRDESFVRHGFESRIAFVRKKVKSFTQKLLCSRYERKRGTCVRWFSREISRGSRWFEIKERLVHSSLEEILFSRWLIVETE